MAADRKYCRRCGTENSKDAKFCRKCGTAFAMPAQGEPPKPVKKEEYLCEYCGQPIEPGVEKCSYCGADIPENVRASLMTAAAVRKTKAATAKPVKKQTSLKPAAAADSPRTKTAKQPKKAESKPAKDPTAPKKSGKKLIAAVTAAAFFLETAFGYPGFLRNKKSGGYSPAVVEQLSGEIVESQTGGNYGLPHIDVDSLELVNVAEGTLTTEERTLSEAGVSVSIGDGFMGDAEERGIEINRVPEKVNCSLDEEAEVPLTIYEVNIDGIESGSMISIDLPMDKDEAPLYGAGYIDEETGIVRPCINEYDPETGILSITTTHLTKFCGIPIENEKTCMAALEYVGYSDIEEDLSLAQLQNLMPILKANTGEEDKGNFVKAWSFFEDVANSSFDEGSNKRDKMAMATDILGLGSIDEIARTAAEGASNKIYMTGNMGSTGEIMNTNWGKAGAWKAEVQAFGKSKTTIAAYNDKLASTYPSGAIEKISDGLQKAGWLMAAVKIAKSGIKEGWTSGKTAKEAYGFVVSDSIGIFSKLKLIRPTAAMNVAMIGVALFSIALDTFYTEALEGRKEVYVRAYNQYYSSKDHHRSDDQWIAVFKKILKNGGTEKDIMNEIDRYVNEFWNDHVRWLDADYYEFVMTEDEKIAWGAQTAEGLTPELMKELSDNYKGRLMKNRMPQIFTSLTVEAQSEMEEQYLAQIQDLRRTMNQTIELGITSGDTFSNKEKSDNAGLIVRFKDLNGKVDDPKSWQTTLSKSGRGHIDFTLFAHMFYGIGNEIEVVRGEGPDEEVLFTDTIYLKDDYGTGIYGTYIVPATEEEETEPVAEPDETEPDTSSGKETDKTEAQAEYAWVLVDTITWSNSSESFSEYWPNYCSATAGSHNMVSKMIDPEGKKSTSASFAATCEAPPSVIYAGDTVSLALSVQCTSVGKVAFSGDAYVQWDPAGLVEGGTYGGPKFESPEGDRNFQAVSEAGKTSDGATVSMTFSEGSEGQKRSIYFAALRSNTEWQYEWRQVGN